MTGTNLGNCFLDYKQEQLPPANHNGLGFHVSFEAWLTISNAFPPSGGPWPQGQLEELFDQYETWCGQMGAIPYWTTLRTDFSGNLMETVHMPNSREPSMELPPELECQSGLETSDSSDYNSRRTSVASSSGPVIAIDPDLRNDYPTILYYNNDPMCNPYSMEVRHECHAAESNAQDVKRSDGNIDAALAYPAQGFTDHHEAMTIHPVLPSLPDHSVNQSSIYVNPRDIFSFDPSIKMGQNSSQIEQIHSENGLGTGNYRSAPDGMKSGGGCLLPKSNELRPS
jgi:hypothetical protein